MHRVARRSPHHLDFREMVHEKARSGSGQWTDLCPMTLLRVCLQVVPLTPGACYLDHCQSFEAAKEACFSSPHQPGSKSQTQSHLGLGSDSSWSGLHAEWVQ